MQLKDKTILITGGTSGIGRALVDQLAPANESVVVIASNAEHLQSLRDKHRNVHTYRCSLANKVEVEKTIHRIFTDHGDLSIVFNNAGIQTTPMFCDPDFRYEMIQEEVTINFTAPCWICSLALEHFLFNKQPAAFVNVTSGLAFYPKRSSAVYCATKAAVLNFSRSLRYQLDGTPVRVYAVILPMVDTPMTKGRDKNKISPETAASAIIDGVEKNKEDIYVGKAKLIPILSRISPGFVASILKKG